MRTLVFAVAMVFLACNGAFAQSHTTHNLQSGKPPIFGGGATARAFDIQNSMIQSDTMRNLDGWTHRSQTGSRLHALIVSLVCIDDTAQVIEDAEKADIQSWLISMARDESWCGSKSCRGRADP